MWSSSERSDVAAALAHAFLAGSDWDADALVARGTAVLDRRPRWLRPLARTLVATYRDRPADRPRELAAFVEAELERRAPSSHPPNVRHHFFPLVEMGPRRWPVPEIATSTELAAFLDVRLGELHWLADTRSLERVVDSEQLRHYRYAWLARGNGAPRVIERPKRLLKDVQRRILHQILDLVPPHSTAHGFRRGHSALTHARRHVGQQVVLRFDLEDFFASIPASRVFGVYRALGYPERVAYLLTGLSTNLVPHAEWARVPVPRVVAAHHRLGRRLATPHLPQGAPTSPALANLCALAVDRRVSALALAATATYSRYADDLVLSGDSWLLDHAKEIRTTVAEIAAAEGFRVNERKSQLMTRAGRQRIAGIVVNAHPNTARREYDLLRAILNDARLHGAEAANRARVPDFRAHVLGRIAWTASVNPARAKKLYRAFDAVDWDDR